MLDDGFVKLFRSLLQWEWYKNQNTKDVFIHLLLTANYCDQKYQGMEIRRGQVLTSYAQVSAQTGISLQCVRTAVKHLESTGELTRKNLLRGCLFTVNNYDRYQGATCESTSDQQAANMELTSDQQLLKKDKKAKKAKEGERGDPPAQKKPYGEFGKVKLSDDEYAKLAERLGKSREAYIDKLDAYIASTGKRYSSHYATVLNWWRKDNRGSSQKPSAATANSSLDKQELHDLIHRGFADDL